MPAPYRILFIGNSYTSRNDLPSLVRALAAGAGVAWPVETALVAFGGASLAAHWNRGMAQALLEERRWDAVVLQDQSTRALRAPASLHEYGKRFAGMAQAVGAKPFLYLPWARENDPGSLAAITSAHEALARDTGAVLVPVGRAWQRVRAIAAAPRLYDADGSHPSPAGSYLSACVFCATLFGVVPCTAPEVPAGLDLSTLDLMHRIASEFIERKPSCSNQGL
jgi:hypothetical protein